MFRLLFYIFVDTAVEEVGDGEEEEEEDRVRGGRRLRTVGVVAADVRGRTRGPDRTVLVSFESAILNLLVFW